MPQLTINGALRLISENKVSLEHYNRMPRRNVRLQKLDCQERIRAVLHRPKKRSKEEVQQEINTQMLQTQQLWRNRIVLEKDLNKPRPKFEAEYDSDQYELFLRQVQRRHATPAPRKAPEPLQQPHAKPPHARSPRERSPIGAGTAQSQSRLRQRAEPAERAVLHETTAVYEQLRNEIAPGAQTPEVATKRPHVALPRERIVSQDARVARPAKREEDAENMLPQWMLDRKHLLNKVTSHTNKFQTRYGLFKNPLRQFLRRLGISSGINLTQQQLAELERIQQIEMQSRSAITQPTEEDLPHIDDRLQQKIDLLLDEYKEQVRVEPRKALRRPQNKIFADLDQVQIRHKMDNLRIKQQFRSMASIANQDGARRMI